MTRKQPIDQTIEILGGLVRKAWNKSPNAWGTIKPAVYAGIIYLGAKEALGQLDPIFDKLIPLAGQTLDGYGSFLADNAESIFSTTLGAYLGIKTYSHFRKDAEKDKRKGQSISRKLKGTIGTLVLAPLTLASVIMNPPSFGKDIWHRYNGKSISQIVEESAPVISRNNYLDETRKELMTTGKISPERFEKDLEYLKGLGYPVTEKDLFYMTKVVAGESGNYYNKDDYIQRQREDMAGIIDVVIDRVAASKYDKNMRFRFNEGKDATFAGVVMKYTEMHKPVRRGNSKVTRQYDDYQFDIAENSARRKQWSEGFNKKDIFHGERWTRQPKLALAYMSVLENLENARFNPMSRHAPLLFQNPDFTDQVWEDQPFGYGYTMKKVARVQDHDQYAIVDESGKNPVYAWRERYFKELNQPTTN